MKPRRAALVTPPSDYRHHSTIDLKDRSANVVVQLLFLALAAAFAGAALLFDVVPEGEWGTGLSLAAIIAAGLAYVWVHEATHGLLLTALTGERSRYAVRLPYLTAGNDAFVSRRNYLLVTLGPLVLWGVVLLVLLVSAPDEAFLTLYVLCALNVAGSAGDAYLAAAVVRAPAAALVRDDGNETTILVPRS